MGKKDDLEVIKEKEALELLKAALSTAEEISNINFDDLLKQNKEMMDELSREELAREMHFQGVRYALTLMALCKCDRKLLEDIKALAADIDKEKSI